MKFYCHHSTGCYIEADTAESAQEQLCELIRENIEPSHIEADPCEDGDTEGYDTANAPAEALIAAEIDRLQRRLNAPRDLRGDSRVTVHADVGAGKEES